MKAEQSPQAFIRLLINGIKANTTIDLTKDCKGYNPPYAEAQAIYHKLMEGKFPNSYTDQDKKKHLEYFELNKEKETFKRRFNLVSNYIRLHRF